MREEIVRHLSEAGFTGSMEEIRARLQSLESGEISARRARDDARHWETL